jgi:hypothetical protein
MHMYSSGASQAASLDRSNPFLDFGNGAPDCTLGDSLLLRHLFLAPSSCYESQYADVSIACSFESATGSAVLHEDALHRARSDPFIFPLQVLYLNI